MADYGVTGGNKGAIARFLIASAAAAIMLGSGAGTLMAQAVGDAAPDFTVDTVDGKYTLSGQRGKITVYFFSFPG